MTITLPFKALKAISSFCTSIPYLNCPTGISFVVAGDKDILTTPLAASLMVGAKSNKEVASPYLLFTKPRTVYPVRFTALPKSSNTTTEIL